MLNLHTRPESHQYKPMDLGNDPFSMVPTPDQIRAARDAAALSQAAAAELIYAEPSAWQAWEEGAEGMHADLFELFLIKTGQVNGA